MVEQSADLDDVEFWVTPSGKNFMVPFDPDDGSVDRKRFNEMRIKLGLF